MRPKHFKLCFYAIMLLAISSGCATKHYRYGCGKSASSQPLLTPCSSERVSVGGEHPWVDRIETAVQRPRNTVRKWLGKPALDEAALAAGRAAAVEQSQAYFSANGLGDVYIDVDRYEPREQWERLKANDRIHPVWKYTGGTLSLVRYSLLPNRAFHIDRYNPFTNTLDLNSARPVNAVYHSADAKEFLERRWIGGYAIAQRLPLVPIFHRSAVASEAIGYAQAQQDWELEQQLYPLSYARIGSSVVSQATTMGVLADGPLPANLAMRLVGRAAGSVAGKAVASQQDRGREEDEAFAPLDTLGSPSK